MSSTPSSSAYPSSKSNSRVVLEDCEIHPEKSLHWQGLSHLPTDKVIENGRELVEQFRQDVHASVAKDSATITLLAKWSCISGYCEALSTHKDPTRRYSIFPIPIDAINRLVQKEFVDWIKDSDGLSPNTTNHRDAARRISNEVWKKVPSKPSVRDELHANSLYVCLRGNIDNRTLDCFGAAVVTIAGLQIAGYESYLTLSEDHAYESHPIEEGESNPSLGEYATCEVAIPGNTKSQQQKRGKEISETFSSNVYKQSTLTPRTSWLYMAANPVICKSYGMALAAVLGNINCQIEKKRGKSISSRKLYEIKRDLLWVLHDEGYLESFPFALSELGDCEENVSSPRGLEWVTLEELENEEILVNEKLFIDAILVSRKAYVDGQIYPYCYLGHYHKDAGRESSEEEYRLVEAMRLYCNGARVASGYVYEVGDSLQLVRTMTKIAELLAEDILSADSGDDNDNGSKSSKLVPRKWTCRDNAVAIGTWLLGFFDSLLFWEERSGGEDTNGKHFVEILNPSHKHGISKLFSLLEQDVRADILSRVYGGSSSSGDISDFFQGAVTEKTLQYFHIPKSTRLASQHAPLAAALCKKKISIGELELAMPQSEGGRRRRKKPRK